MPFQRSWISVKPTVEFYGWLNPSHTFSALPSLPSPPIQIWRPLAQWNSFKHSGFKHQHNWMTSALLLAEGNISWLNVCHMNATHATSKFIQKTSRRRTASPGCLLSDASWQLMARYSSVSHASTGHVAHILSDWHAASQHVTCVSAFTSNLANTSWQMLITVDAYSAESFRFCTAMNN